MPIIEIGNNRISYKFEVHSKYSLVSGDSGVGKTTLCRLVNMVEDGIEGVTNKSSHTIMTLRGAFQRVDVSVYENTVIFVDEESPLFRTQGFEQWLQTVNAYFVFITRDLNLKIVPISVDSIYTVQESGKFHYLKPIDARFPNQELHGVDWVLTEDSNSGMQFIKEVLKYAGNTSVAIETARGKDNIVPKVKSLIKGTEKNIILVYDASGFGVNILDLKRLIDQHPEKNFFVIDWESFENYMLGTPAVNLPTTLKDVGCTAESLEEFSYKKLCKYFKYSKHNLIHCFKIGGCKNCNLKCSHPVYKFQDYIYWKVKTLYDFLIAQKSQRKSNTNASIKPQSPRVSTRIQPKQKQPMGNGLSYTYYMQQAKRYSRGVAPDARTRVVRVDYKNQRCWLNGLGAIKPYAIRGVVLAVMEGKCILSNPSALREWRGFIKE